ncbi:MAG: SseB family protein, partial [Oscillospiraceae bacterium]|nr:SseB family protein [Oscillospiraceae bacterium]
MIMDNFTEVNPAEEKPENPKLKELFAKRKQCGDEQIASIMNEIAEEIVMNARFLSLVRTEKGDGNKVRISFALLNDGKGRNFYPLFTDTEELMKWQLAQQESPRTMVLAFDNYAQMIVDKNAADGMVINPFGDNLVIEKETVSRWWDRKQ